jgi:hypothetical protein
MSRRMEDGVVLEVEEERIVRMKQAGMLPCRALLIVEVVSPAVLVKVHSPAVWKGYLGR